MTSTTHLVPRQAASAVIGDLTSSFDARLSAVGPRAVIIQLALMCALSLVTIILFSLLRPANRVVYAPKSKYYTDKKAQPPEVGKGFFAWVKPLIALKEDDLMDKVGLDAVAFLRFLRMSRWIFTVIAVLCCGILIPANVVYNLNNVRNRTSLSILTIVDVKGNLLYLHVGVTYLIDIAVCWFIFINTRRMLALKLRYFRSEEYQNSLHSRSIMITQIPKSGQSDQALENLLQTLRVPYPTSAVNIGRHVGNLPELIEKHEEAVESLEQVLTTYLRRPDKPLPSKRPTLRTGGFLGMGGTKHDAIDYWTAKIQRLENTIEAAREGIDLKKPLNYGWASFVKVPYAHTVAKALEKKRVAGTRFELAPRPADIIWTNLEKTDGQRRSARFFIGIVLVVAVFFYTIPLIAVSFVSNLTAISVYVPFLQRWSDSSPNTFSAFAGIVPPILAVLLQLLLPMLMRALSRRQGTTTHTKLDHAVLARYFAFLVISQFLIFSLVGVVFNLVTQIIVQVNRRLSASEILSNLAERVPNNIQSTYIRQSNYWLTWFALRGFNSVFEIAQAVNLLWIFIRKQVFGRTPRDMRNYTAPQPFDYAVYTANSLFMATVGLIYAPLAPLVTIFAAVAFFISSFIFKYQLLYVCITKREAGGSMWWMMINRLLVSMVFMHLLMILTIGLQRGWLNAISAAPPILVLLGFKIFLRRYLPQWHFYQPNDNELAECRAHKSDERKNRLAKRFGHPALHKVLEVPMVHAHCQHLLPQVYHGRIDATTVGVDGKEQAGVVAGGLQFAAMEKSQLELSREEYLRQQDAWETGSMASTAVDATPLHRDDAKSDYFHQQRRQYLAQGPGGLEPHAVDYGQQSQENLLRTARWQDEQRGHVPQRSNASVADSYGRPASRYDPRFDTPGGRNSPYGQPHHQQTASLESFDMGGRAHGSQMSFAGSNDGYAYPPTYRSSPTAPNRSQAMSRQSTEELMAAGAGPGRGSAPMSRRSTEDLLDGYRYPPNRR